MSQFVKRLDRNEECGQDQPSISLDFADIVEDFVGSAQESRGDRIADDQQTDQNRCNRVS